MRAATGHHLSGEVSGHDYLAEDEYVEVGECVVAWNCQCPSSIDSPGSLVCPAGSENFPSVWQLTISDRAWGSRRTRAIFPPPLKDCTKLYKLKFH